MTDLREWGESAANAVLDRVGRGVSKVQERRPLAHDLLESDDAYLVVFDAPGVEREDVQVRFLDNEVRVRLDRFREFHEGFEMRLPGRGLSLSGAAELPADASVDPTDATATLTESGTVHVRIPKDEVGETVAVGEEGETDRSAGPDADDPDAGVDATGATDRAAGDVVDAVTDRDVDTSTEADADADVDADPDPDARDDDGAGDYGGAVTGDETNTGGVADEADDDATDSDDRA